jgi:flagellar biosynthesis GTPase FlhF
VRARKKVSDLEKELSQFPASSRELDEREKAVQIRENAVERRENEVREREREVKERVDRCEAQQAGASASASAPTKRDSPAGELPPSTSSEKRQKIDTVTVPPFKNIGKCRLCAKDEDDPPCRYNEKSYKENARLIMRSLPTLAPNVLPTMVCFVASGNRVVTTKKGEECLDGYGKVRVILTALVDEGLLAERDVPPLEVHLKNFAGKASEEAAKEEKEAVKEAGAKAEAAKAAEEKAEAAEKAGAPEEAAKEAAMEAEAAKKAAKEAAEDAEAAKEAAKEAAEDAEEGIAVRRTADEVRKPFKKGMGQSRGKHLKMMSFLKDPNHKKYVAFLRSPRMSKVRMTITDARLLPSGGRSCKLMAYINGGRGEEAAEASPPLRTLLHDRQSTGKEGGDRVSEREKNEENEIVQANAAPGEMTAITATGEMPFRGNGSRYEHAFMHDVHVSDVQRT